MKRNNLEKVRESLIVFAIRSYITGFLLAITGAAGAAMLVLPAVAQNTTITVDGTQGGRTFDGIGAISGGGGNSRLLIDYPPTDAREVRLIDLSYRGGHWPAPRLHAPG